jgi:choline dehydrogenase-like flavoprotein
MLDPNYWDDPHDKEMAIKGLRLARDIMRQRALARFVQSEVLPGSKLETDAELFDYACANAKTDHHPVGTCTMGPDTHPASVVTPDLRLIGLKGLRIVDASVMPFVPSCNTNAPTIMVAEKAADHILGRIAARIDGDIDEDSPAWSRRYAEELSAQGDTHSPAG